MKNIFTLVLAAGTFFTASAQQGKKMNHSFDEQNREKNQYNSNHAHEGIAGGKGSAAYGNYPYPFKERAAELRHINREFDQKAAFVSSNRQLRYGEKARQLRILENQRRMAIRNAQAGFEKNTDRFEAGGADKKPNRRW